MLNERTPKITIVLPLSRDWRVEPMREQLETLHTEGLEIDLLVIIDNHEIKLDWYDLNPRIKYMDQNHPGEANSYARRQRIADIMNLARTFTPEDTNYVFILEDDTEIKPHYLKALLPYGSMHTAGDEYSRSLSSGIQAGRWASSMLGIWKVDNLEYPTTIETLRYSNNSTGWTTEVDATGIYCTVTDARDFRETPFRCDYQGPDVNYCLDIKRKGTNIYAQWDLLCGHATRTKTLWPTPETGTIKFIRDDLAPGGWKQVETVLT